MKKQFRLIALVLSLVCLISIVGCQSQPEPIPSEEPSSVAESPSSQDIPSELAGLPTIPFEVGYQKRLLGVRMDTNGYGYSRAIIIRSKEELDRKYPVENRTGEEKAFFKQCDKTYFRKKAIVVIRLVHETYGESVMKVYPVVRAEDDLIVNLYVEEPADGFIVEMDDMSTEYIYLVVKQSDIKGVYQALCNSGNQSWDTWE